MIQFQFTKKDDATKQIIVVVDIMDELAQRFTIMDIRGSRVNVENFKKCFPWHLGSVLHISEIKDWYKTICSSCEGIIYGYEDGPIIMDCEPPVPPTPTGSDYFYFEAVEENSTVSLISTLENAPNLEYSIDGVNFQEWQHTTTTEDEMIMHTFDTLTLGAVGDKVYLRGNNATLGNIDMEEEIFQYSVFNLTGQLDCSGSVTSLIDNDGITASVIPDGCFTTLFAKVAMTGEPNTALLSAPSFGNVTEIGNFSCSMMYAMCSALTQAPDMSKIVSIGDHGCSMEGGMFMMCTSLEDASDMTSLTTIGDGGIVNLYYGCQFQMSDDGEIFNFDFPKDQITAVLDGQETPLSEVPDLDLAEMMGNINGFNIYYNVSVESNNTDYGTVTGGGTFLSGTEITIQAISNEGYGFVDWSDGNTDATRTIIVNQNYSLTARFQTCVNISLSSNNDDWGSVLGGGDFPIGKQITIQAIPLENSEFAQWSDGNTNAIRTIVVSEAITLTAIFIHINTNYLNFTMPNGGDITLTKIGTFDYDVQLEYSVDEKQSWNTWEEQTNVRSLTLPANGKVYIRNVVDDVYNRFSYNDEGYYQFAFSDEVYAAGEINTLSCKYIDLSMGSYIFYSLFEGCTTLKTAPALPATSLSISSYRKMFKGCTALTQAPALPATTFANNVYTSMFEGCTSLTQAPALPATTISQGATRCYCTMFKNCTSLTQAPELPATTLSEECYYYMFEGCTSLTQAPTLPATTLARNCYCGMFDVCVGLTQAPALPFTILSYGCYSFMFVGCTGLTSAPSLPATTLAERCYYSMFTGCTFDMSSDGTTFNFDFGAAPPVTAGSITYNTYYDLAQWMGNTNGFTNP